ncbi:MAG: TrkH family potassium uptake protein [Oscillospiraceae bacterium]|jgi:trk system potassium uptake protein TrkH|nr:TrkH family potassium uptake protein [Oscillospiraceae bacterium]
MSKTLIFSRVGSLLLLNSLALGITAVVDFSSAQYFAYPALVSFFIGVLLVYGLKLYSKNHNVPTEVHTKTAFGIVALGWVIIPIIGMLPYIFYGTSVPNAIFESFSGFTTTGSTVFPNTELLPRGILFWRAFTHFIGGAGVITLLLAVSPNLSADTVRIVNVESTGVPSDKFLPKTSHIPKVLYGVYLSLTVLLFGLFSLGGMGVFDAVTHAFSIAGTGGFSTKNNSFGYFTDNSVYLQIVAAVFMLLFSVNLSLFFIIVIKRRIKAAFASEELRLFLIAAAAITLIITAANYFGDVYDNIFESLLGSFFQVSSSMSTTGLSVGNFAVWGAFTNIILMFAMFCGGMSGSTAGGFKFGRLLLLIKTARREVYRQMYPNSVKVIQSDGKSVDDKLISKICAFFFLYVLIAAIGILSLAAAETITRNTIDFEGAFYAVFAMISNSGIAANGDLAIGDFSDFCPFSKILLAFIMFIGRLEIYPAIMIISPGFWKK